MWWVRCSLTAVASCSLLAHPVLAQQRSSQTTTQVHYVDAGDAGVSVDKHTSAVHLSRPAENETRFTSAVADKTPSQKSSDDCTATDTTGLGFLNQFCNAQKGFWQLTEGHKQGGLQLTGHTQIGYHTEGTNGDGIPSSFNDYPNRVQVHQQWLTLQKATTGNGDFEWGFRMDWFYGTDGPDSQASDNAPGEWDEGWDHGGYYGHAIPQLFAEVAMGDTRIMGGHFFSPLGYESVNSTQNFFYSHTYSMVKLPFTHTGVLAEHALKENLTITAGWINGFNTAFPASGGSMAVLGTSATLRNGTVLNYTFAHGELNPGDVAQSYVHNIIVETQLTDRLQSVFESNLWTDNSDQADAEITLTQYLFWDFNDRIRLGVRSEWMDLGRDVEEFNAVTVGINYRAAENLILRPELRVDNMHRDINNGINNGDIFTLSRRDSTVFSIDAIWSY